VTKLSADRKTLAFSTYLGGSGGEFYLWPTVDRRGNILVVGSTSSQDFPVTGNALQKTYGGGANDAVMAILSGDGSQLLYATYLGGSGDDLIRSLALGPNGEVYLVGKTDSGNFPVTPGAAQTARGGKMDAFVVKLEPIPTTGSAPFIRSDANADGATDIGDGVCVLAYLFGSPGDTCEDRITQCNDVADANDDGGVDLGDGIYILQYLFVSGPMIPEPYPGCGTDSTEDDLTCVAYALCQR
jgi:hypothetical protein